MAFPDHLLTLATLRLLTLTPLASSYNQQPSSSSSSSITEGSTSSNDRFHSVRSQPLRILSELTAAYLQLLGNAAKSHAEQAGRTICNALDAREAIEQFGGSIEEVDDWARECQLDRGILSSNDDIVTANTATPATPGERAGGDDANDLGALLKDTARNVAYRSPTQVIEYAPLTDREAAIVTAVQHNDSLLPFLPYEIQEQVNKEQSHPPPSSSSSSSSHDAPSPSSSRATSPPPPSYNEATSGTLSLRKREKSRAYDNYNIDEDNDPLSFLPPFPDLDATQASLQQTIIEDESGRIVKRARRALDTYLNATSGGGISKKNASLAWLRAVPYDVSSLAEYEGGKFSVPSMKKKDSRTKKKSVKSEGRNYSDHEEEDEEEDDALAASSLPYFLETFNRISLDYEQQGEQALLPLRHNSKRKRAATAIHSNILNPSDDSLSGSIPALPPRHAKKQAGWIPYPPINPEVQDPSEPGGKAIRPFPIQLHPFSTQLPASITEPVPQLVLPHASRVLAPPMHPRYPMAHTSIRTLLESSSPALFARTTRIGPPGPLLENGGAGAYQVEAEKPVIPGWPGDAMPRMMGWNFDWEIGNELEDGIKERKSAGIQDMAVHEHSSLQDNNDGGSTPAPQAGTSANGLASSSTNGTLKEEYQGPAFPPLPIRPPYDPLQASLNAQKEQERKIEEEAMTFQEVQEDKESERLHELEVARVNALAAAEEEKERARVQKEKDEVERKKAKEEEEGKRKEALELAKKEAEKPKAVPKLSFSLKLGGSGTSSSAAASASAAPPSTTAAASATPPQNTPATLPSELSATTAQPSSLAANPEQSSLAAASVNQSTNMWNTGAELEQDYRAPAADITSISQPPIVLPGTSTSTLPAPLTSTTVTSSVQLATPPAVVAAAQEEVAPVPVDPALQEEAEVDAEGDEEDAENESEDDDLFDEVEVDHGDGNANDHQQQIMEGDAVYATSPAYQSASSHNTGEMHVEVEEMDM